MSIVNLAKILLYKFDNNIENSPSWDNSSQYQFTERELPITDPNQWLGRYVYCPIRFRSSKGKELVFEDAIATITKQKNIVSTPIIGLNGSVKEYISEGDYDINIIINVYARDKFDIYPEDEIRALSNMLSLNENIEVQSSFFDIFDINKIVIKSFNLSQMTAFNYQQFNISALSDEEYNVFSTDY